MPVNVNMSIEENKYKLFEVFRGIVYHSTPFTEPNCNNTDSNLTLKSVKIVGPHFDLPTVFSQNDVTFLLNGFSQIIENNIPLTSEFSGSLDTIEKNGFYPKSDFLTSEDKADIIFISHIVRPPEGNDLKELSLEYESYVTAGGISKHHHEKGIWPQAVKNHDAKIIMIAYHNQDDDISQNTFQNTNFEITGHLDLNDNMTMVMLVDKDYSAALKNATLQKTSNPSPSSNINHRQPGIGG